MVGTIEGGSTGAHRPSVTIVNNSTKESKDEESKKETKENK